MLDPAIEHAQKGVCFRQPINFTAALALQMRIDTWANSLRASRKLISARR